MSLFAERLRDLRRKNKLTQNELAKELNVSGGTIGMWETDRREPDMIMIRKIANYFNVTLDELLNTSKTTTINTPPKFTEAQDTLIKVIASLSDENCRRVQAFITGITIAEEEKRALIQKFKNRED